MPKKKKKRKGPKVEMILVPQPEEKKNTGARHGAPRGPDGKYIPEKGGKSRNPDGRPVGSIDKGTKIKLAAEKQFHTRTMKHIHRLFNAQLSNALGKQYLMRVDIDSKGKEMKPVVVEDLDEIKAFLADEVEGTSKYYYLTTKDPDNKAIDSLLDRLFGRPSQKVALGADPEAPPVTLSIEQAVVIAQIYANGNPKLGGNAGSGDSLGQQ